MLIALEGIDGSGKTTTAGLLSEELTRGGFDAAHVDKRRIAADSAYATSHLASLSRLIWVDSHGQPIRVLGHDHWVHINAAYHCGLHDAVVTPAAADGKVLVVDGWIYKFAARASVTGGVSPDDILSQMGAVPRPDLVIMLDVDAEDAFGRRESFNAMEEGGWNERSSGFVSFQGQVSEILHRMAEQLDWHVERPDGRTAEVLAADLASQVVLPRLKVDAPAGVSK